MSSFANKENKQLQPKHVAPGKKKLTREEQLAIWKKKRANHKFDNNKSQFNRIKNIQKRLNHSGKKRAQKDKKVRRIDEQSAEKKMRSRSVTSTLNKMQKEKSLILNKNIKGIMKPPHRVTKSPHRIAVLQQRLSNSAAKRKERERKRRMEQKQKAEKARHHSSKPRSARKGSILKKEISIAATAPITKTIISSMKKNLVHKHCDSPSSFENDVKLVPPETMDKTAIDAKKSANRNNILTPTIKRIYKNINYNSSSSSSSKNKCNNHHVDSEYPLFHVNSPAVQKIIHLFSPLMSPLVKRTVIEEECKIIKEEDVVDFDSFCNAGNEDFSYDNSNDGDNNEAFDNGYNPGIDEVQFIAPKDVSKVREAPSSIIKMKKIKLNAKDQINTGHKHAITPVRRSVRVMTSDEDEARLEEVDFNFVPNKHLENAYFSKNKKSIKKLFQIQTKDGSFRRPTPRPLKKKATICVPVFNGGSAPTTTSTTPMMPPPAKDV